MTDRYNAFTVILENDIREDDAQPIINAIKQIRGVLDVQPAQSDVIAVSVASSRVRVRLWDKIHKVFEEEFKQQ